MQETKKIGKKANIPQNECVASAVNTETLLDI